MTDTASSVALRGTQAQLWKRYDLLLLDLDGVVYLVDQVIPEAAESIAGVRDAGGAALAFVTNNASRRPAEVAKLLSTLGVPATAADVTTSAQAAAKLLASGLPVGTPVLVVGAPALAEEVAEAGLAPVRTAVDQPAAVIQGYGPDVGWAQLAEASIALRAGARWMATNPDRTMPSRRGLLPGNGAMVAALATATGRPPDVVVGKPEPGLLEEAIRVRGARRPLMVGDSLGTDIEGATRVGIDSLLVLTGVTDPAELLAAPPGRRPSFIAADLRGLHARHPTPTLADAGEGRCEGWTAYRERHAARLSGAGDPIDALRALCVLSWSDTPIRHVSGDGPAAIKAVRSLSL